IQSPLRTVSFYVRGRPESSSGVCRVREQQSSDCMGWVKSCSALREATVPTGPRPVRDIAGLDEAPLDAFATAEAEVVADRRAQVDPCVLVAVGAWILIAENILPVVHLEGTDILPLGVANLALVVDREPAALAD